MNIRLAAPDEAEECWIVRNLAIRHGCAQSYESSVIQAWTPEEMPESFRAVIIENPFFVIEGPDAKPVATGYLDLATGSVEAIFTSPDHIGKGLASQILEAIKWEARKQGFARLTLSSTPNAQKFYEKHGFIFLQESCYSSRLAQADLRCMEMAIEL